MPLNADWVELRREYLLDPSRFCFFVGAGLSRPCLPGWIEALKRMVSAAARTGRLSESPEELIRTVNDGRDLEYIAGICADAMGLQGYRTFLEEAFDIPDDLTEPGWPLAYRALINLSPRLIITTNYDRFPEIIGQGKYRTFNNQSTAEALRAANSGSRVVYKLHGDLSQQDSIVFTSDEYIRVTGDSAVSHFMHSALSSRTIIFVGCSLQDMHLRRTLEWLRGTYAGMPPLHYAFIANATGYERRRLERTYGIKTISYHAVDADHSELTTRLLELGGATSAPAPHDTSRVATTCLEGLKTLGYEECAAFVSGSEVRLTLLASASTLREFQAELFSVARALVAHPQVEYSIRFLSRTPPERDLGRIDRETATAKFAGADLIALNTRDLTERDFWGRVQFSRNYRGYGLPMSAAAAIRLRYHAL